MFRKELESLRGYAALSVAIAHCFIMFNFHPQPGFLYEGPRSYVNYAVHAVFNENAAVVLFFVLSGYVLSLQFDALAGTPWQRYLVFSVRRFFRIAPAMYVVVFAAFALAVIYGTADSRAFRSALLFNGRYLVGPLWTITVEMACSLVFPLLFYISRRGVALNAITLVVLYALMGEGRAPEWMRYTIFFHLGALVGPYGRHFADRMLLIVALPVYCLAAPLSTCFNAPPLDYLRLTGLAAFVMLCAVVHRSVFEKALSHPAARLLGKISYSLYLVHYVLLELAVRSLGAVSWPLPVLAKQAILAAIVVPMSIVVAKWMQMSIEAPMNALGRSLVIRMPRISSSNKI